MGYSLHIQRANADIGLAEWLSAARSIAILRVRTDDYVVTNPHTGEEICLRSSPGDLEISVAPGEWVPVLTFSSGRGSFAWRAHLDTAPGPVRRVMVQLARHLDASIVGDEGESFDW